MDDSSPPPPLEESPPPEPPPIMENDPPPPLPTEPPPPPEEEDYEDEEQEFDPNPLEEEEEFYFSTFENQYNLEYYLQPEVQTLFQSQNYAEPSLAPAPAETPEEYYNYVKTTMEEQGYDFQEWVQEMKGEPEFWWLDQQQQVSFLLIFLHILLKFPLFFQPPTSNDSSLASAEETSSTPEIDYTFPPPPPPKKLMGMKSFRYLETRVLANFLKDSEDERMDKIKARLGFMKKVKPPKNPSVSVLFTDKNYPRGNSKQEVVGVEVIIFKKP